MHPPRWSAIASIAVALSSSSAHAQVFRHNYTSNNLIPSTFSIRDDRPPECPPCFNCKLEDFTCYQAFNCNEKSGTCNCPPGFGGPDCSEPLCDSLAEGADRAPRGGDDTCKCKDGWEGINCNVCNTDDACVPLMPDVGKEGAVCYQDGALVKENHQMCDITNKKILDQLAGKKPQATFSCNAETKECNFQFWVDQKESFFCALDTCSASANSESNYNTTDYNCDHVRCQCIPGRFLCGEANSIDIGDFLKSDIKGPASFKSRKTQGGSKSDGSSFSEPAMDGLISSVFGDDSIFLSCNAGECLYKTQVPGQAERPVKAINTPLIAGIIAGTALFVVAVALIIWYSSRRAARRSEYGFIRLSENEEDDNAKLLADHEPAALYFEDVSYAVKGKQVLSGITGAVDPGQIMAIMGASGAGKTTFLDILARKNKIGTIAGSIYLNGEKVSDEDFKNVIGFVDQEDTLLPTLTVHETILDSALLRLPREMSRASKEQKVEDVEKQLGIYHIRDSIIGSEEGERGISGGEKRRVGIACELVTSPSILFLDEPTSGLDAYNAFNVVESLVGLVKNYNRTVILTIHQPRSNIVALFDQLVLLAKGRTVYAGPFSNCQSYFDSIGYACPPGFNIADYLIDLTMHAGTVHTPFDDNNSLFERDGVRTSSSSAIAVKSLPSVSNFSVGQAEGTDSHSPLLRPKSKRVPSIRQQQERDLITRKKSNTVGEGSGTPKYHDDEEPSHTTPDKQWLRMQRQQAAPPPQILEDPDQVPQPAPGGTGTNLDSLITSFVSSDVAKNTRENIQFSISAATEANGAPNGNAHANESHQPPRSKGYNRIGWLSQFYILSVRTWRNIYRNPMLMLTHYAIAIVLGVLTGFLFFRLTDDIPGFQNRLGLNFFLLALFGFSTLTSLTVFAPERLLFVRERAKGYYSPVPYFAAKVVFDIVPLRLLPPIILGIIVYPMTGLVPSMPEFLKFMMFLILFNLAAAGICLFIGVLVKNPGVANLIGSLVMLFSLLFGGFLLNHDTIPQVVLWLQYLSIFHFAFEGLMVNEARYLQLIDKKYGLDISVPGSAILSSFGFKVLDLPKDAVGLAVFAASFIILAYVAMHFLLVERR